MAIITKTINADEKTWQEEFYKNLFGEDLKSISIDCSTDGYTRGILFEHNETGHRKTGTQKLPRVSERLLMGDSFWSDSYYLGSSGGANLEVIEKYIKKQGQPKRKYVRKK